MPGLKDLIHNERVKITASFVNLLGVSAIGGGVIAQSAAVLSGATPIGFSQAGWVVGLVIWTGLGLYFCAVARWLLGGLRE